MAEALRDDSTIGDASILWRRIPSWHFIFDENQKQWRPSSAAFDDDRDGSPTSVFLAELVASAGRRPADVLLGHDRFALAAITAGAARACGLGVVRDPLPAELAHALVIGHKPKSVQRRLAKAAVWVIPPPQIP